MKGMRYIILILKYHIIIEVNLIFYNVMETPQLDNRVAER
ncbi:unnamed protein product [Paramecium octaurelia]|uniref:Uncharacterized protein n=1 Tax=Paramecium octaurelia TaxID=43137 RepID=A0A8S1X880_PAROT|nr:unnamed protein product [Paramecium octaurelia]